MKLYAFPMSCSFAVHATLIAADLPFDRVWVGLPEGRLPDGRDYRKVNPRMQVPSLEVDGQGLLTETPAILQYVAELAPGAGLAPPTGSFERSRLQEMLNYLSSEVHKQVLWPLSNIGKFPADADGLRAMLLDLFAARLDYLAERLGDSAYLVGERFSVADAFMLVILHWAGRNGLALDRWPTLAAYQDRLAREPAVAEARRVNFAESDRIIAAGGRV